MGGSSGGGSSGGTNIHYIRYAPYVESKHSTFLVNSENIGVSTRESNPYEDNQDLDFTDGLYSAGYCMSSFPSLYDMFGKFMSGLNIETLWAKLQHSVQNEELISAMVTASNQLTSLKFEKEILPKFKATMRDFNAVVSSNFIIGSSVLEQNMLKENATLSESSRSNLISGAINLMGSNLGWNESIIKSYLSITKAAVTLEMNVQDDNYGYARENIMWPFTTLEQERANLAALKGSVNTSKGSAEEEELSTEVKVLSGAVSGAMMGATIGSIVPGVGTAIGAVIGGVIGGLSGLL